MLNLLFLDQEYITHTLNLKHYLLRFLLAQKPFPIQVGDARFLIEPRSSDWFTIYEIYSARGYLPMLPHLLPNINVVVDFGANIGIYSIWATKMFHPKSVYAVEMEPNCYQRLVKNIALNHLHETIRPFQAAIFNQSGMVGTKKIPGSTFFQVTPDKAARRVRSFSFEDFLKHTGLERIDLLKIDIEGAEKYLLTEANVPLFQQRVGYILLETHSLNDFNTEQAVAYLSGLGFRLAMRPTPYVLGRNYIIDACNPSHTHTLVHAL
jgi:FkbM family methyltransferase